MNHIDRQDNINNQTSKQVRVGVHIGMPKTGTTSLQELYFNRHPDLAYLGQTNIWDKPDAKNMLKGLILGDNSDVSKEEIHKIRDDALARKSALVISDEALTMGEFMLRSGRWPIVSNHYTAAKQIKQLLGDVHILIVIRNQADWLYSWHRQGLKTAKYSETEYNCWLKYDLGESAERLFNLLNYDELYDAYVSVFGKELVHLKIYEQYMDNLEQIAIEFISCLGLNPADYPGLMGNEKRNITSDKFNGVPKYLQKFIRLSPIRTIVKMIPDGMRGRIRKAVEVQRQYGNMSDSQRNAILKRYEQGNRVLFDRLGIEIDSSAYFA